MIEDLKERKEKFMEVHNELIARINDYYYNGRAFTMVDILGKDRNDYYYRYMGKGIVQNLMYFGYVDIIAIYNGNKNYVYQVKKEVKNTSHYHTSA